MQAFPGFADPLDQPRLHVHVDIFRVHHPFDFPGLRVRQDLLQPGDNPAGVFRGDNALFAQHRRVGDRSVNILLV